MIHKLKKIGDFRDYRGQMVPRYERIRGTMKVHAVKPGPETSLGLAVTDYKAATLRECARMLGVNKVSVNAEHNGRSVFVCLRGSEYTIWDDGVCVFVNGDGDTVAFMDSI